MELVNSVLVCLLFSKTLAQNVSLPRTYVYTQQYIDVGASTSHNLMGLHGLLQG
jgi:hypothetical protein